VSEGYGCVNICIERIEADHDLGSYMTLAEGRHNNSPIPRLMLVAAPIYTLFGACLLYGFGGQKADYFRYFVILCVHLSLAALLFLKQLKNKNILPSVFGLIGNILAVANTLFQPLEYCSNPSYFLSVVIICASAIETSVFLERKIAYLNIAGIITLFFAQAIRAPSLHELAILGPLIAFLLWECIMEVKIIEVLAEVIRARELNAYRSTIVTLNHEFNNANAACLLLLEHMEQQQSGLPSLEMRAQLKMSLERVSGLIKRVSKLRELKQVPYVSGGHAMIDLHENPDCKSGPI